MQRNMAGTAAALVPTDRFEELMHKVIVAKAHGGRVIKGLASDVSFLDDDESKRARLAGALLVLKDGNYTAVPHHNPYWRGTLVRVHAGARATGCTTFTSEELGSKVEGAYLGLQLDVPCPQKCTALQRSGAPKY